MERKSNIELLRILAFVLVVFTHITPVGLTIENGILSHSFSWYYATVVRCLVTPAVSLFIIISGYVTYLSKEKFDTKKTIIKLMIPILCFLPLLFVINILETKSSIEALKQLGEMIMQLTGQFHHLWYIVAYMFIVLITPIIIKGTENYDRSKFFVLLITSYILIGIGELIEIFTHKLLFQGMFRNNILLFLVLYLTGFYIAKYNVTVKKFISGIIVGALLLIEYIIFWKNNPINMPLKYMTISNSFQLFNICISIFTFLFFKEIKKEKIKIINKISKLTYGGYIIHTFYIYFNQKIFPFLKYIHYDKYYLYDICFTVSVIVCSLITEKIRQIIIKIFRKYKDKLTKKNI